MKFFPLATNNYIPTIFECLKNHYFKATLVLKIIRFNYKHFNFIYGSASSTSLVVCNKINISCI